MPPPRGCHLKHFDLDRQILFTSPIYISQPEVALVGVVHLAVPPRVALQELVGRDEGAVEVVPAVKQ